jgi:MYXO-CTERM domain-containing protein
MTNLKPVRFFLLAAGLALTTATAQTATDTSTSATTDTNATHMNDRRGFDWGWLGLLGLAGLLGLRRPNLLTETRSGTGSNRV